MEQNLKKQWIDVLLILFIFLFTASFPFSLFIHDDNITYILNVSLRCAFLVFAFIYIYKVKLDFPKLKSLKKSSLKLLPFLIICFSNFLVCLITKSSVLSEFDGIDLLKSLFLVLLIAVGEELVFRSLLFNQFRKTLSFLKSALFSSLIFSVIHLFNITGVDTIVPSLIQVVYSFGLGMILCYMYETGQNYLLIIVFHFLFNFLNDYLVTFIYELNWDVWFYVINSCVGLVIIAYYLFCVFYLDKRNNDNV